MAFHSELTASVNFTNIDDLLNFVKSEEQTTSRISIYGLIKGGARFRDDSLFGVGKTSFRFNDNGIREFCRHLGVPYPVIKDVSGAGLPTDILNDYLGRVDPEKIKTQEFVYNEPSSIVLGIVSSSYVGYSNSAFLNDILESLYVVEAKKSHKSGFFNAYYENTNLNVRFLSDLQVSVIRTNSGNVGDITKVGFDITNSMVGDHAVKLSYYFYRLVCTNGMTVPVTGGNWRIVHAGKRKNFQAKLHSGLQYMVKGISGAKRLIETLSEIKCDYYKLAHAGMYEMIFDVIPSMRQDIKAYGGGAESQNAYDKFDATSNQAKAIEAIPVYYGRANSRMVFGSAARAKATMFDFVNVFTEYAQALEMSKIIKVEQKAGALAEYISKNKRKFS